MKYATLLLMLACIFCPFGAVEAQTVDQPGSRPFSYAMTVKTVRQKQDINTKMFLVDVRSPEMFVQFSIQNSLNIPLFAVKTKSFLKTRPLVLVDEGYRPRYLNELCRQLRKSGFDAWFLYGGLNAWNLAGEFLQGDPFAQYKLQQVSTHQMFLEHPAEGWLMVDASAPDSKAMASPFPHTQSIPFIPSQPASFLSDLQQRVAQYVALYAATPLILLYTTEGTEYVQIEQALSESEFPPRFFLQGGAHAYTQIMTQQQMIGDGPLEVSTECSSCAR